MPDAEIWLGKIWPGRGGVLLVRMFSICSLWEQEVFTVCLAFADAVTSSSPDACIASYALTSRSSDGRRTPWFQDECVSLLCVLCTFLTFVTFANNNIMVPSFFFAIYVGICMLKWIIMCYTRHHGTELFCPIYGEMSIIKWHDIYHRWHHVCEIPRIDKQISSTFVASLEVSVGAVREISRIAHVKHNGTELFFVCAMNEITYVIYISCAWSW